jgi:uncharacterized protein YecT (DUF1311 family)
MGFSPDMLVLAASFECSQAKTNFEKTVCSDLRLSALDEEMAKAYRQAMERQSGYTDRLQADQREWLKDAQDAVYDKWYLKDKQWHRYEYSQTLEQFYRDRILELENISASPVLNMPVKGGVYTIKDNDTFDFVVRLLLSCEDSNGICNSPGQVIIYKKGSQEALQVINQSHIEIHNLNGKIDAISLSQNSHIDAYPDLFISNGSNGAYGSRTDDIYIYDPKTKKFIYSRSLTSLNDQFGNLLFEPKEDLLRADQTQSIVCVVSGSWKFIGNQPIPVTETKWKNCGCDVKITEKRDGKRKYKTSCIDPEDGVKYP